MPVRENSPVMARSSEGCGLACAAKSQSASAARLTLSALCTQKVSDVVVDPEVLLQHVLPRKRFVALVAAVAFHA